ncbi:hypothetical protein [Allokutzneria oryzae]|uniref:DUF1761 domain-containing protein n=1 Tax=Allokutzneria oryzae TaxID=1378989 RepID=A0ABV5ZZ92_9PSEU
MTPQRSNRQDSEGDGLNKTSAVGSIIFGIYGIFLIVLALTDLENIAATITGVTMGAIWVVGGYFGVLARWGETTQDLSRNSAIAGVITLSGIAVGVLMEWLLR